MLESLDFGIFGSLLVTLTERNLTFWFSNLVQSMIIAVSRVSSHVPALLTLT